MLLSTCNPLFASLNLVRTCLNIDETLVECCVLNTLWFNFVGDTVDVLRETDYGEYLATFTSPTSTVFGQCPRGISTHLFFSCDKSSIVSGPSKLHIIDGFDLILHKISTQDTSLIKNQ